MNALRLLRTTSRLQLITYAVTNSLPPKVNRNISPSLAGKNYLRTAMKFTGTW